MVVLDAFFRSLIEAASAPTLELLAGRLASLHHPQIKIVLTGPVFFREIPKEPTRMFTLLDDQKTTVHLTGGQDAAGNPASFLDANGKPIPLNVLFTTPPVWSIDHGDLIAITPAADGLSCACVTTGKLPTSPDPTIPSATLGVTATTAVPTATMPAGTVLADSFAFLVSTDTAQTLNLVADPATSRL